MNVRSFLIEAKRGVALWKWNILMKNTIRVLIGNEDLADRGITFLDLLGNHKDVENFFYSIFRRS